MTDTDRFERFRPYLLAVVLLVGCGGFAYFTHGFYPIHTWLFWRYAGYWLVIGAWLACCSAFGYELVARTCYWLTKLEQLLIGVPIGVLSFALAIFALGIVHVLHPIVSVLLPLLFLAFGFRRSWRDVRRLIGKSRLGTRRSFDLRFVPVWLLALLGVFVLYFCVLSPEAFTFDARWYHMPMAQRYALSGKISAFGEGFWMSAFPQLLSYLYTWVFLLPGAVMFDRMELGVHIEFLLFLVTLAQIPVVVRRLAPHAPWQLSWCLRLAFPGVYLYDGNLNAGADHVAGFFTLPLALAVLRAWPRFEWRRVALVAVLIGAVALVKYTSWAVCASAGIIVGLRGLWLGTVRRRGAAWLSLATLAGVVLLVTAPHWLKNWAWYGDPLYPQLAGIFPSHPWGPEFAARRADLDAIRRGAPMTLAGLQAALSSTVTFSFIPNDWEFLHRDVPVFGSLFTLSLPCLLFLRRSGRLWGMYLSTMLAIVFWYMLAHYDRYLQTLVPLMAASTAACFAMIWKLGLVPRVAVTTLVAFQVIWGLDVPFFRTHNQIGDSPIRHVAQFLASGFEKRDGRLSLFQPMPTIGKAVPKDAVVLTHDSLLILGMDRNWVSDQNQSVISYGAMRTPRKIHEQLTALGVTHLVWPNDSAGMDSIAGDLAFYGYALRYTLNRKPIGGYTVSTLANHPPPDSWADPDVAYFGCGTHYSSGWYPLSELTRRLPGKPTARRSGKLSKDMVAVTERAGFVVVERDCQRDVVVGDAFMFAARRGRTEFYVRKNPLPEPPK